MKKFLYIFLTFFITSSAFANQPVDWQLGFQKAASETMRDIVNFHDKLLLPIIIAISVFVLFLMVYACIRFRASANPVPSKRTHNVAVEVLWTLIPCLILIVMAVPSFKILYKQDAIPKADITVKAIGYQWYWGYEYPDENIFFDSYMIETKDLKENELFEGSIDEVFSGQFENLSHSFKNVSYSSILEPIINFKGGNKSVKKSKNDAGRSFGSIRCNYRQVNERRNNCKSGENDCERWNRGKREF